MAVSNQTTLWIWQRQGSKGESAEFFHASLSIQSSTEKLYMSYFDGEKTGGCMNTCRRVTQHLHSSMGEDSLTLKECEAVPFRFFTLDTQKIQRAFFTLKLCQNKKEVFSSYYPPNAVGFTLYLLEQGGILKLSSYKRVNLLSRVGKYAAIWGILCGTILTCYRKYAQKSTHASSSLAMRHLQLPFAAKISFTVAGLALALLQLNKRYVLSKFDGRDLHTLALQAQAKETQKR